MKQCSLNSFKEEACPFAGDVYFVKRMYRMLIMYGYKVAHTSGYNIIHSSWIMRRTIRQLHQCWIEKALGNIRRESGILSHLAFER